MSGPDHEQSVIESGQNDESFVDSSLDLLPSIPLVLLLLFLLINYLINKQLLLVKILPDKEGEGPCELSPGRVLYPESLCRSMTST